tara:strand:+ start:59 stop:196 length:138 start_codon:yes stop_codon:yes gene_type:complete
MKKEFLGFNIEKGLGDESGFPYSRPPGNKLTYIFDFYFIITYIRM